MNDNYLSGTVTIDGLSAAWQDLSVIAQTHGADVAKAAELSLQYKLKDWLKLNSLFCVNQLFFEPIIAPVSELGEVVVIDDSLGQLSLSLALKGADVTHIASDHSEKDFCENRFRKNGLQNVSVITFDSDELESIEFNTLMLARPASKYKNSEKRLAAILQQLVEKSESVVVIEANKYGLRRLVSSRLRSLKVISMFSPYWWKNLLSTKRANTSFYGVLNGSNSIQLPRISLWAKGQLESDRAHQSFLKRLLSSLLFFKFLLPGFMATSSLSDVDSWFERVLKFEAVQKAMTGIENGFIKRIFAGNRGVTVIIFGNQSKNCVWRIASEREGIERVRINAQALQDLSFAQSEKSSIIPSLLYFGEEFGSVFTIEEMLPGNDMEGSEGDEIARSWMKDLQSSMFIEREYSEEVHSELVGPSVKRLKAFCASESVNLFEEINQLIKNQFVGRKIKFVPLHGDLKEGNYLYGENGQLSAVIDWDMYSRECFPLVDHLIQLIYQNIKPYQDDGISIFSGFVDRYIKGDFSESINNTAKDFDMNDRDVHAIVLFSLIRVLDLQFVDALKTHRGSFNSLLSSLSIILEHIRQC